MIGAPSAGLLVAPKIEEDRRVLVGIIRGDEGGAAGVRARVIRRNADLPESLIILSEDATVADLRRSISRLGMMHVDHPDPPPGTRESHMTDMDHIPFLFDNDPLYPQMEGLRERIRTLDQRVTIPGYGEAFVIFYSAWLSEMIHGIRRFVPIEQ